MSVTSEQRELAKSQAMKPEAAEEESKVEATKRASHALRGTIASTLADSTTKTFSDDDQVLLKFHGIYQQDDRDTRRSEDGKTYSLMIRLRLPGGILTDAQWLRLDELADTYGNGTLRLTTRQSIQYHGVLKDNQALISTIAACGDVGRNVMAPAAPFADGPHREAQRIADEISRALIPATKAYHEIWLDGEAVEFESGASGAGAMDVEPLYGPQYLPRKFKVGVALDTDNSVDIYSYDCGLVGIVEGGRIVGFNVLVGGGLGMTHNKPDTFARLATPVGFVQPEFAVDAVRTVAAIFRDHGNRSDRRHARIKYLIEAWGAERFAAEIRARVKWEVAEARSPESLPKPREHDYLGSHEQGDGKWFYGVFVESGRVLDRNGGPWYRSAFREIVRRFRPGVRLTPMQSILFTDLAPEATAEVVAILRQHAIKTVEELSHARRWSMACPALPTCGLALADSERVLPSVIDGLEAEIESLGVGDVPLTIRMTGCPNGCARPYNADIAFVGRKPGVYHVFVGGGLAGDRFADLYAADVSIGNFVAVLRPLLVRYRDERRSGEALGDFYQRVLPASQERGQPRRILTGKEAPTQQFIQVGVSR